MLSHPDCTELDPGQYEVARLIPDEVFYKSCAVVDIYRTGANRLTEKPLGEYCLEGINDHEYRTPAAEFVAAISSSHVEANAPKGELFDQYLKRDITAYFCNEQTDCRVDYAYLREGATQSGVSYPNYYLWVKCFTKEELKTEGAVRVEAVDQKYFRVTDFLSAKQIAASPEEVERIFPFALVDRIEHRAKD